MLFFIILLYLWFCIECIILAIVLCGIIAILSPIIVVIYYLKSKLIIDEENEIEIIIEMPKKYRHEWYARAFKQPDQDISSH